MLKTLWQRSGLKLMVAGLLGWLAISLPEWVGLLELPGPWDAIVAKAAGLAAEVILLLRLMVTQPSIDARALPARVVAEMGNREQAVVLGAVQRQRDKLTR